MRLIRHGFSVAELLVSLTIGGVVAGLITATVVRQQRIYSSASEVLDIRSQLRDAADILASDIRGAAVGQFGLPVMSDTAIEMFTVVASSVACTIPSPGTVGLPPSNLAAGNTLTSLRAQPDTGDLALMHAAPVNSADSIGWEVYRVVSFAPRTLASSCPPSTGFTTPADADGGSAGYLLTVSQPVSSRVRRGSIIHFLRRARYSFYKSSDGEWYLGYRRCNAVGVSICAAIQPVSGPYRPYAAGGATSGLSFRYYDAFGTELTAAEQSRSVARVEILLRGASGAISLAGDAREAWRDSALVEVSPRNRAR